MINATAWQLPPDGELRSEHAAPPEILNSCKMTPSNNECKFFASDIVPPPDCDMVPLSTGMPRVATRCRAATWDAAVRASLLEAECDGGIKIQNPSRPFLSLMLPEWVHEKAAEDEAAGLSRCGSLVSFGGPSPATSNVPSATSSCANSPTSSPRLPSWAESRTRRGRRSGVCWADLEESDEDEPVASMWSTISTAPSSPDRSLSPVPASLSKAESRTCRGRRSGACWADLEGSDQDEPVASLWSTISTAPSSPDRSLSPVPTSLSKVSVLVQGIKLEL